MFHAISWRMLLGTAGTPFAPISCLALSTISPQLSATGFSWCRAGSRDGCSPPHPCLIVSVCFHSAEAFLIDVVELFIMHKLVDGHCTSVSVYHAVFFSFTWAINWLEILARTWQFPATCSDWFSKALVVCLGSFLSPMGQFLLSVASWHKASALLAGFKLEQALEIEWFLAFFFWELNFANGQGVAVGTGTLTACGPMPDLVWALGASYGLLMWNKLINSIALNVSASNSQ